MPEKSDGPRSSQLAEIILSVTHSLSMATHVAGPPVVTLALCLGIVWSFGGSKTKDDFVRELLFQETTKQPFVQGFFVLLILASLVAFFFGRRRDVFYEGEEMRRIAQQKSEWQERALRGVSHSAGSLPPPRADFDDEEELDGPATVEIEQ